jgi:Domain of unknown function (DUF3859)
MMSRLGATTSLAIALSAASNSASASPVEIVAYGVFAGNDTGSVLALETTKGSLNKVADPVLLRRTTCIPARLGTRFGVTVRAVNANPTEAVRVEIRHPGFPDTTTGGRRIEAWNSLVGDSGTYLGWSFEEDYELVTGQWTIHIIQNGRFLARQDFEVVRPDESCPAVVSSRERPRLMPGRREDTSAPAAAEQLGPDGIVLA